MVPIMAGCYLLITVLLIVINFRMIPSVIGRIFQEAFGFRQVVAGGFGAVLMNGIKRGLFSNEAGSGSAPCAAATAETDHPAKVGLGQALGVFIDTILICSCTAMIMLLTPETLTQGLTGMDLLQEAMRYHLGTFGVVFIAITLWLFSFPLLWESCSMQDQTLRIFWRQLVFSDRLQDRCPGNAVCGRTGCLYRGMGPWRCGSRSYDII